MWELKDINAVNGCNLDYLMSWIRSLGYAASIEGNQVVWYWRIQPDISYHASSFTEAREKLGFPKW